MPPIPTAVRFRVFDPARAADYEPFIDFYCGKDRLEKHEVNRTVRRMWASRAQPQEAVLLEMAAGKDVNGHRPLVGVCGIAYGELKGLPNVKRGTQGAYIYAIGVDVDHQRRELAKGWRYGNALAQGALEAIFNIFGSSGMPYVLAKVKRANKGSKCLFDEHGFENKGDHGELLLLREPGLDPAFRRELTWSRQSAASNSGRGS
jgi:ribosomal protein S18 acetylase RimI-like enzyme